LLALNTIYQGPLQRAPGTADPFGTSGPSVYYANTYGFNVYSHLNFNIDIDIYDLWEGSYLINGILADFSPILATVTYSRGESSTGFHMWFDL
jgi:hypothetical protein